MKTAFVTFLYALFAGIISAQNSVTIEFSVVDKNGGTVYVSLFNSEKSFKEKQDYLKFEMQPVSEVLQKEISLPEGEYVLSAYQDHNGNGKLDVNLIGIPKEKFAFSNYDAKSPPGGFNRHKVAVNSTKACINLQLFKL
jgi:uncharacterized protein (DUF2141 family)